MLKKYMDVAINDFYERISVSPCFADHLRYAIESGVCLYCDGLKRISFYSGGLCFECQNQADQKLVDKVKDKFRVSVVVTETSRIG